MFVQSEKLTDLSSIQHGFFGKQGGVSTGVYDSLNCGPQSSDNLEHIIENRWRAIHALGLEESKLFGLSQIHSKTVYTISAKSSDDFHQGDALVTKVRGYSLSVLGADCAPVFFADSKAGVIGAAHSGWRGAVTGVIESVVQSMCDIGAHRENIQACIGPTIHQQAYEVRDDFIQQLRSLSDFSTDQFISSEELDGENKHFFDLPAYILAQCSYSKIQAEFLEIDTYSQPEKYFSFRRNTHENITDYGRQISIIALR